MTKPKAELVDREGQTWEWLTPPPERWLIVKSWLGEHPADGSPVTVHKMVSLSTAEVMEEYFEVARFESLEEGPTPEMKRLG